MMADMVVAVTVAEGATVEEEEVAVTEAEGAVGEDTAVVDMVAEGGKRYPASHGRSILLSRVSSEAFWLLVMVASWKKRKAMQHLHMHSISRHFHTSNKCIKI